MVLMATTSKVEPGPEPGAGAPANNDDNPTVCPEVRRQLGDRAADSETSTQMQSRREGAQGMCTSRSGVEPELEVASQR